MTDERSGPSILAITSELPWPLDSGGHLRTFHLLRAIATRFRIRLIAGLSSGQERHLDELERAGIGVRPVVLQPRGVLSEGRQVAAAMASREPYVLYRRHNRPEMRAALREELAREEPAVLYLDHLDSCVFANEAPSIPFVVDLHNIYSLIAQREAREPSRPWPMRWYLGREAVLLERAEARAVQKAGAVFSVSTQEREHFAAIRRGPVHLVPNGVDCGRYNSLPVGRLSLEPNILFIGSLSWPPNAGAARFLAREVLPRVQKRYNAARLTIVGRNPTNDVRALADGRSIAVAENVPDILPYLRDASVLAVPLSAGGGTRLKILEAFAAGLPVVSTPIGCEGIAATHEAELVVADDDAFADAVCSVFADPAGAARRAGRARELAREQYDWPVVGRVATEALLSLVGNRR